MSETGSFPELIRRVRNGDEQAAVQLIQEYEPAIRRIIRIQMRDSRLRRLLDATDICQSVLASFFLRVAVGQFELDTPDQLVKLLSTMARNKLASHARKERTLRRDNRRTGADVSQSALPGHEASPSLNAVTKEMIVEVRRRLSPEELQLVELRHQGLDWTTIAAQLGETPVVLRKRLSRALDRAAQELGLEEGKDE